MEAPDVITSMYRDVRIAHDLAHLRLRDVANSSDDWTVAEIIPAEGSGDLCLFGAHLNTDTGQLVAEQEHPESRIVVEGKWRIKQKPLKPEFQMGPFQSYEWTEVAEQWKRKVSIDDVFPLFYQRCGGHILCVHDPKVAGHGQFRSPTLIPDEWLSELKPALTYLSKNRKKLKDLAKPLLQTDAPLHPNPFVLVAFTQELMEDAVDTNTLAKAILPRFRGRHIQAIATYSLARRGLKDTIGPLLDCVQSAKSPEDLVGMMAGLQTFARLGGPQRDVADMQLILDRVKERRQKMKDKSSPLGPILDSFGK